MWSPARRVPGATDTSQVLARPGRAREGDYASAAQQQMRNDAGANRHQNIVGSRTESNGSREAGYSVQNIHFDVMLYAIVDHGDRPL